MHVIEKIKKDVKKLPEKLQLEVLDYIQYLINKTDMSEQQSEKNEWTRFSLENAMRGMEDENSSLYSMDDLKWD
jgi:hypothetical protein